MTSPSHNTLALGRALVEHVRQLETATARQLAQFAGTTPRRVRYALAVAHEAGPTRLLSIRMSQGNRGRPETRYAIDPAPREAVVDTVVAAREAA